MKDRICERVVDELERILLLAKRGHVTNMAIIVETDLPNSRFVGTYCGSPIDLLAMVAALGDLISESDNVDHKLVEIKADLN